MKKIKVKLSSSKVSFLKKFKRQKNLSSRELNRANILLLCHRGKQEKDIADFLDVDLATIWRTKQKYVEKGLKYALNECPRPGQPKRYYEQQQTELTAIACSNHPDGSCRWTLELLTEKMRSGVSGCKTISKETVRLMLKKMNISLGKKRCGVSGG